MKVVLCNGCFEILHWGHLMHLQQARTYGDVLIVSVTEDAYVNKGPNRPISTVSQRMDLIRALAIVDRVFSTKCPEDAINAVHPNVYCKGIEYMGNLREQKLVESLGGKVVFTHHDEGSKIHTGSIIQQYKKNVEEAAGKDK